MKAFKVKKAVMHNAKMYPVDSSIELDNQKHIDRLIALKVIDGEGQEVAAKETVDPAEGDLQEKLQGMTVDELKEYAKQNDINLSGVSKKDDIITEILLA